MCPVRTGVTVVLLLLLLFSALFERRSMPILDLDSSRGRRRRMLVPVVSRSIGSPHDDDERADLYVEPSIAATAAAAGADSTMAAVSEMERASRIREFFQ